MYTIDASVWVNSFDQREQGHETSRQLLEVMARQSLPIIVPTLVLPEVAGAIGRTRGNPTQAQAFAIALGNLLTVTLVPLDSAPGTTIPDAGSPTWATGCRCRLCRGCCPGKLYSHHIG